MNSGKYYLLILNLLAILTFTACSSGGGSSGSTANTTPVVYTYPDGSVVLSNGAHISLPTTQLFVQTGHTVSTDLLINGGNSAIALQLAAIVTDSSGSTVSSLPVSFSNANVVTGEGNTSSNIIMDTASVPVGDYLVEIVATNLPAAGNLSQTQSSGGLELGSLIVSVSNTNMIKASYIQLGATGSLSSITAGGYAASNIIIFAFADPTTSAINTEYLKAMQQAIKNEGTGTINLLSIGGQTGDPSKFSDINAVVNNITAQINAYNIQLTDKKIKGVDLDLEGGFSQYIISQLAQGFKRKGLVVSVAPQVYLSSGSSVDISNPTNLVLTSGYPGDSTINTYGPAIASGNVDYIFAQTYNTNGWTVGGFQEYQVQFFGAISKALNNTVRSSCTGISSLCIPQGVNIVIGTVSNYGASGTRANIFNPTNSSTFISYNQTAILNELASIIHNTTVDLVNSISGVMMWSLNNDYQPAGWNDPYAIVGGFSNLIYGAPPAPQLPYFILQVSNNAPNLPNENAYGSATLVVNGAYWVFGTSWNSPIAPQANQLWGTLTSSKNPLTPGVADSSNLDKIFANGVTSFTTSQIIINGYPSQTVPLSPAHQFACPAGTNYTFKAGHSYNVIVNAVARSCSVQMIN